MDRINGSHEILKLIPNRYPMLLLDRVISLKPFDHVHCVKNVSVDELIVACNPQRTLPPTLLLEAMAQAASLCVVDPGTALESEVLIAAIDGTKFLQEVRPGDTLTLRATLEKRRRVFGIVKVTASVGNKLISSSRITFSIKLPVAN